MKLNNRFIFGILSLLLAAVIAFVALPTIARQTNGKEEIVRITQPVLKGEQISSENAEVVEVGGYNLPSNIAHQLSDVNGLYATADLAVGDYILTSKISSVPVSSDVALNSTIHSNSCNSTYRRMMTLAKRKYNMDDSILMQIMVEAYPIIVFTKQLEDRSRKIMEIIEGEDYQDGRLIAHSLYKYEVEDNVTDDRGETRVVGHHKKIGLISDSLKKRLLDNGISNKELEEFMQPPKEVG